MNGLLDAELTEPSLNARFDFACCYWTAVALTLRTRLFRIDCVLIICRQYLILLYLIPIQQGGNRQQPSNKLTPQ